MRAHHRQFFCAIFAAAIMTAGNACKHSSQPSSRPISVEQAAKVVPIYVAMTQDKRFQPDVKLVAKAQNETVEIEVQNATDKTLPIDAFNFGVILEGEGKEVHKFDPELFTAEFPKVELGPGDSSSGEIMFKGLGKLAGQRLVFYHADVRPSLAYIQGDGAKAVSVPVEKIKEK